jgi:hypothetical protein
MNPTRRSLLTGAATGIASLLARPALRPALAAAGVRRIAIVFMPNCCYDPLWRVTGGRSVDKASGDAKTFTLAESSKPFEIVRDKMIFIEGVSIKYEGGDSHLAPSIKFLSGGLQNGSKHGSLLASKPTIDQILAGASAHLKGTPFPSLQLAADTRSDRAGIYKQVMSYGVADVEPLVPENGVHQAYTRVFGKLMPVANPAEGAAKLEAALAEERSVLDFVSKDLDRLAGRLPGSERLKVEAHMQGIRELEGSLSRATRGNPLTVTLPSGLQALGANVNGNHPKVVPLMFDLIRTAFAADLTRVVTFEFGSSANAVGFGEFMPGVTTRGVHTMAHVLARRSDVPTDLVKITTWYAEQTARFIKSLADTPDVDGGSVLDSTLVVLYSDVTRYHVHADVPLVLFGGSRMGLSLGRALKYDNRTSADLWTAVAPRAFDVPLPTFGNASENRGPLPELFA